MNNKILFFILLLNLEAKPFISVYNNKLCILEISKNLHIEKQGICPKISELSYFFNHSMDIEKVIKNKPTYISDKFNNDNKIIPYFGQYFNFIDTTMYFEVKKEERDNRLIFILLKNQIIYIKNNMYIFNRLKYINNTLYIAINQFNFKNNLISKKLYKKISENANNLVYIYDNDF